jgi:hypothetical protein
MSEQNPGQGAMTTYATPRDAKAQAKAEKAYRKASRPWFKKKRFWALGAILLLVLISALTGGGDDTGAASSGSASDTNQETTENTAQDTAQETTENTAEDTTPAFPGAQESDVVGNWGDELLLGSVVVRTSALGPGDATLGSTLCTTATMENGSDETVDFNAFDWKLQAPSGTILNTGFTGSDDQLSSGQIAPGGTASGDVCFDGAMDESGQYIVIYEPIFSFFSDRAAWINDH